MPQDTYTSTPNYCADKSPLFAFCLATPTLPLSSPPLLGAATATQRGFWTYPDGIGKPDTRETDWQSDTDEKE